MAAVKPIINDRRQKNNNLVSRLKEERDKVWALYCKVGEMKPFSELPEIQPVVTQFSQLLVDYISLGHFGVYEYLLSGNERREAVLTEAKEVYPEFSKITDAVLLFNDKYDEQKNKFTVDELESDLSALGEHLAKRIELEDVLCRLVLV